MTQFAYYHSPDNTIAEMPLSREATTAEAFESNVEEAREFGLHTGLMLMGIWNQQWSDSKWYREYERLEERGHFTAERREQLFDE